MRAFLGVGVSLLVVAVLAALGDARADGLEAQREKFEIGVAHFREGRYSQAIAVWEPVLKALGENTGYRLLYNLGVAYDEIGDATNATDRLRRFLARAATRAPEEIPPEVHDYETDAKKRLARLDAAYARIRIATNEPPPLALRIDGVARNEAIADPVYYVAPGHHEVVLRPGERDEERRGVDVPAGSEVTVTPAPRPPPLPPSAPPSASVPAPREGRPFSPVWIGVVGGASLAALGAAVYLHEDAKGWRADANDPALPVPQRLSAADTFANRKGWYEAALIGAGVLGAGTGALATWWFVSKRDDAGASITPRGVVLHARF